MASAAEERIRVKVEAALREAWPSGRIVHELMLKQGGCRIDVACITPERLIVCEIKSEKDVLTRLERQVRAARLVCDQLMVVAAYKKLDAARAIAGWLQTCGEDEVRLSLQRGQRRAHETTCNSPARLEMLWASELRRVAGTGPRDARGGSILRASDYMTGAEVRKGVCAALRARPFPRADAPMLCELFPEPSVGSF